jgi:hypothetical protein
MVSTRSRYVADSSVLIDMENGKLVEEFFLLPFDILTTDLIIEELNRKKPTGSLMIERGLIVKELSSKLMAKVPGLKSKYKGTSAPDISCFILAEELLLPLITGDGDLRKAAESAGIKIHGTLFVLDKLVDDYSLIPPQRGADSLMRIQDCGARLPEKECLLRLRRWNP